MQFDVIIGNPPYQQKDGGHGRSAMPIYHKFVQQAKKLNPHYLTMIIPARWFTGGKGLDIFRKEMLDDSQLRKLVAFDDANEVFPGVDIAGGICYFLWERYSRGLCEVVNIYKGIETASLRQLNEFDTFIRNSKAVSIVRKVMAKRDPTMNNQVSSRKPFGLDTYVRPRKSGDIRLRWQHGVGLYHRKDITVGVEMIDKWKVITSYASCDHAGNPWKDGRRKVFSAIDILPPGTICNETYLVVGTFESREEAENLVAYMKTRFFRFLVSQLAVTQHITRRHYALVPILDMNVRWTDEMLCERYGITPEEFVFIESMVRPMNR